jgi:hypothetical protein
MFNLDDNGITGLVRIFATRYRATSLQDIATTHAHKVLEDSKEILKPVEVTDTKRGHTKLTEAQLTAAALSDSPDDPETVVVTGDPWANNPNADQKEYDSWLHQYFRLLHCKCFFIRISRGHDH